MSSATVDELRGSTTYEPASTWGTFVRGVQLSPELRTGLPGTLGLALVATAGQVVIPVMVQQVIDRGLKTPGHPDLALVRWASLTAAVALVVTAFAAYVMNVRLFTVTEAALARLRVRAFRHVHDLSVLHQAAEQRGALVSRVTSDVDQISQFVQWGGLRMMVAAVQLVLATGLMLFYSWPLALLVYACFVPLVLAIRVVQPRLATAYSAVRERVGEMLGAVGESVVGAQVIRAYGVERRTADRIDSAIGRYQGAQIRAQSLGAVMFSSVELVAGIANAAIVVVGVLLGVGGHISAGRLVAFLFLVTLFVSPVQVATEVLDQAQNAIAGWRRVIGVLDTPTDVDDPAHAPSGGRVLPAGPLGVRFEDVRYAYPGGPPVLVDVDLEIAPRSRVAIVGETGSGKTTFAKLLTRLMDPSRGRVLVGGVPLADVRFDSLRDRVVMVPQDGFLFDTSIADNVRYGRPGLTDAEVAEIVQELGLGDWLDAMPDGPRTRVGERGGSLSVGERQLVAVVRAYVADPDVLVLDEATSAVDPATEVRLTRALDRLLAGRTSLTIAHRLATAEAADEVIVVDGGRIVQRGSHATLVGQEGVYAGLHAAWAAQHR